MLFHNIKHAKTIEGGEEQEAYDSSGAAAFLTRIHSWTVDNCTIQRTKFLEPITITNVAGKEMTVKYLV